MASESRLYRSATDRMLFGVSGGMGQYFNLDPTLVRVGWVVLSLVTAGAGVVLYAAMAFIVPEQGAAERPSASEGQSEDSSETPGPVLKARRGNGLAWLLILGGFALFAVNRGFLFTIPWEIVAPAALIVLGLALLRRRR